MNYTIQEGDYLNLGAIVKANAVVFTFMAEKEDACCILIKDQKTGEAERIFVPDLFCRGSLRSVAVTGLSLEHKSYLYEINGKLMLDQYARKICGREIWMDFSRESNDFEVSGGVITDSFDWDGDASPEIPKEKTIMYKLHMRGYTKDKGTSKNVAGTFRGLKDKIPYLKSLGITTLECMPIYEFEEMTIPEKHELPDYIKWKIESNDLIAPLEKEKVSDKVNFWGYGKGNYFAVKASYAAKPENAHNELKELIAALHKDGIEFVMEVYFPEDTNFHLILQALRYWVLEYHVDGFHLLGDNLPIETIVSDALLSRTKLYYVGYEERVIHLRKHQNLGVYRDDYQYPAKKVLNHINADMNEFINQQRKQASDYAFVNYLTSNNGFTLADLFMYNDRHNEANGENNTDGNPWNFSNNYGIEGPSRKKSILDIRGKQWRNAFIMLMLAQGIPLIWGGDEFRNSQAGNNNPYCQDNEIGWVNWKNNKQTATDIEFVKQLIAFRKSHPVLANKKPFTYTDYKTKGVPDFSIHGEYAWVTDLNPGNLGLGILYCGEYSEEPEYMEDVYVGYNFFSTPITLALPKVKDEKEWHLVIDSSKTDDYFVTDTKPAQVQHKIVVEPLSICVLVGKKKDK